MLYMCTCTACTPLEYTCKHFIAFCIRYVLLVYVLLPLLYVYDLLQNHNLKHLLIIMYIVCVCVCVYMYMYKQIIVDNIHDVVFDWWWLVGCLFILFIYCFPYKVIIT